MVENYTLEKVTERMFLTVPESWTDFEPLGESALQERALFLLTAAGMIERRVTFRIRMAGQSMAVEATITLTGETGLAQAMQFVLKETWNEWREECERQLGADPKEKPSFQCERVGSEQWRLTVDGILARSDLHKGNVTTVLDFVLRRGIFDGRPRIMADGRIGQPPPVAGQGLLERMSRVKSDAAPAEMSITNWEEGAKVFAPAFADLMKVKPASTEAASPATNPSMAILRVFTDGIADERIEKAAQLLSDDRLTANEKLTKIDALIPFPATASAEQLGQMLGVSKQAVMKTE